MLTCTAPGSDAHRDKTLPGKPWCPCTPFGGVDLAEWNASHSRRWNHLLTLLRREYPGIQFMRGVEVQARGALHDHAIVWTSTGLNVARVRELAIRAGFGHSVDLAPSPPGSKRAGYYVSKYVTKACDSRESVPWAAETVDVHTGEISRGRIHARYRTWSCSRSWGLTMREVRALAQEQAIKARDLRHERHMESAFAAAAPLLAPDPAPD
jgi:hypothetical protein